MLAQSQGDREPRHHLQGAQTLGMDDQLVVNDVAEDQEWSADAAALGVEGRSGARGTA